MLVLTRKVGERIIICDDIIIEVVEFRPGKVRLGVIAPADIPVHREEIWIEIQKEKKDAPRKQPEAHPREEALCAPAREGGEEGGPDPELQI